jgi:5'-3' exoribonuclease 2
MGVPGFFAWLMKKYKKTYFVKTSLDTKPCGFYVDANCLFHPHCFKVLSLVKTRTTPEELENIMIQRILRFLTYIEGVVNPSDFIYVSVDGVAPLAKMNQQRKRRYGSIQTNDMMDKLKFKHSKDVINSWNNTVISPGTEFMEKLHRALTIFYAEKQKKKSKPFYIYSSYHTAGEGEHKILQHLRQNYSESDDNFVIYGLDADLIFLALASRVKNIYLLREESHINQKHNKKEVLNTDPVKSVGEEMIFVDIFTVRKEFNKTMQLMITQRTGIAINDNDFLNDFIFMCFLLGNDFLPHFPSVDIKAEGLDYIIDAYIATYENIFNTCDGGCQKRNCGSSLNITLLTVDENHTPTINTMFFLQILEYLGNQEAYYFREVLPYHKSLMQRRRCHEQDRYSRELWDIENLRNETIDDPIMLGSGEKLEWKQRYYQHHYGVDGHADEHVLNMCREYLKGIKWVTQYYFDTCNDWHWQYPYNHSPFVSDIASYLADHFDELNDIRFEYKTNIPIMSQLLSVIPPQCSQLVATSYRNLLTSDKSPLIDMFPTSISFDMINKDQRWQCIPLVPTVNVERILNETSKLMLTHEECCRNSELPDIYFS